MEKFAVQFQEVHWDKEEVPTGDGGVKTNNYVPELRAAEEEGKPVILIVYSREENGEQSVADWRLFQMFFAEKGPLADAAANFVCLGMNRLCPCWKVSKWRASGPMILLFNHKGKSVRSISSPQYSRDRLLQELQALRDLAARDANREDSGKNEGQESGE